MAKKSVAASAANDPVFSKESLLNSKHFMKRRDLISALLDDDKQYTIKQVDEIMSKYLKGKVN